MSKKAKLKEPARNASHSDAGGDQVQPEVLSNPSENSNDIFNLGGELVVDVFETNSDFVVMSAIAGVQIKDLDISVEKDMMVIKGQRQDPHEDTKKSYFYQECYWGPFSKKIILPENIDIEKADAQMNKGVLVIKIPRLSEGDKSAPETA